MELLRHDAVGLISVRSAEHVTHTMTDRACDPAQVETYAQRFRFSRADYDDTADRLRQVLRPCSYLHGFEP